MSTSAVPALTRLWRATASRLSTLRSGGVSSRLIACKRAICSPGSAARAVPVPAPAVASPPIVSTIVPALRKCIAPVLPVSGSPPEAPMRRNVHPRSTLDAGHLDDDEIAVIRQIRVPPGRPEIGVVDERQLVVREREHGLDGLVG